MALSLTDRGLGSGADNLCDSPRSPIVLAEKRETARIKPKFNMDDKQDTGGESMTAGLWTKGVWRGSAYLAILAVMFLAIVTLLACGKGASRDILRPDERRWLTENQGRIVLAVETDSAPLVFLDAKGQPTGLAHDYLLLLEAKLGIRFQQRNFATLDDAFAKVHSGEIQVVNAVMETPRRSEFLAFTKPFISVPNAIIVREDRAGSMREENLRGLRVSLVRSFASTEWLTDPSRGVVPDLVPDDLTGLLNVSFGRSDAGVFDLATVSHLVQTKGITNLRVAGETGLAMQLAMGTPKNEVQLHQILEKGLGAITASEREEIRRRWIHLQDSGILADRRFWVGIGIVLLVIGVVVGTVLVWNRTLRRKIALRTRELAEGVEALAASEEKFRSYVHQATDVIFTLDAQGTFLFLSPAWERMFGSPVSEVLGRPFAPFVHPEELQPLSDLLFRVMTTGRDETTAPYRVRHAGGSWRWIVANGSRMSTPKGEFQFFGVARDITEGKQAEEQLRLSEENLAITLHSIGDAVIATDVAGLITRMNPTAERLTGFPLADALGRPLTEVFRIINAQTRVPSVDPVQAVLAHGEVVGLANHTLLLARDGQEYQIADSAAPIHDAAGKILGVVLVFSDVTEQYRVQEALTQTTELLKNASEIAKMGGWELDLASMKSTWSLGTYHLHEVDPLTPVDVASGIHFYAPEVQPVISAAVQAAIDFGTPYDLELPLLTAKGRAFWARAQCHPAIENGRVIKLVGAFQDITERRQAEALLRESEARVRTKLNAILSPEGDLDALELEDILDVSAVREMMENIFDLTGIAVALGDLNGKALVAFGWQDACTQYHRANPEACRNCAESDTVLVSQVEPGTFKLYKCKNNLWDLAVPIHVGDRHVGNLFVGQFFFEDEVPDLAIFQAQAKRFGFNEAEYLAALGRVPRVSRETVNALAEFYTRFSAMISNLSYSSIQFARILAQREQAEAEKVKLQNQLQQSQKMESLGTLAGGVAHDMNNVLGAILGLASAHIGSQPYGSPLHQALDTICKATERGGKMVKSLLSFARQSPAESHKLDMNAILREQITLLERTTLAKVRLQTDLEAELRPILGDASALTHAFMNLCVNAVDAMPENGTLTLHTRNVDNDWIEVVVEDNGTGMPKEVLEKAMEPFYTTKETGKGTGLGLSMVFSTVKAHRGQMAIESEPGQGTRVMLRFPACEREAPVQAAVVEVAEATQIPHGTLTILLIDDDDLIQSSVQMILEVLGHTAVNTAQSGEEALTMLEAGLEPDLVILDMNMPGLGGIGTLPRLRVLRPDVPVLLATGRVDQTALTLASAHPGVTLLSKPFGLRELQKHLESLGLG